MSGATVDQARLTPRTVLSDEEATILSAEKRLEQRRAELGISSPASTKALHKKDAQASGKDAGRTHGRPQKISEEGSVGGAVRPLLVREEQTQTCAWWVEGLASGEKPESNQAVPLLEYLRRAIERNRTGFDALFDDDEKTSGESQYYRSPCLLFIALLKGREEFAGLRGYQVVRAVDPLLELLAPDAEDPWLELFPEYDTFGNDLDPRDNVVDLWDSVPNPMELISPHLTLAEELAERFPLLSARYDLPRDEPFRRVVSLAFWLARLHKGGTFFLGCRVAGRFAGCSHMQASQYLKRAQKEGLLNLRQKSPRVGRASEYDFVFEAVSGLTA